VAPDRHQHRLHHAIRNARGITYRLCSGAHWLLQGTLGMMADPRIRHLHPNPHGMPIVDPPDQEQHQDFRSQLVWTNLLILLMSIRHGGSFSGSHS
jgi:hypothetical protein